MLARRCRLPLLRYAEDHVLERYNVHRSMGGYEMSVWAHFDVIGVTGAICVIVRVSWSI